MYLKMENFAITTGTTTDCWPLVKGDIKSTSLLLTGTTGVTYYLGGSGCTIANGFPLRPNISTSDDDSGPAILQLDAKTFGWANAEINLNQIYVRTTAASQTLYGLYFRRVDEDDR